MKTAFIRLAFATLLVSGASLSSHAEDAVAPPAPPAAAAPAAAPAPASVPRPSIVPPATEAAAPPAATAEPAPRRKRRVARHYHRRYAYWEPFPIYIPHFGRHHFHWARISWFRF